ncbi:HAD hydrolase family protein [Desulfobacter latus]|uniref:HAD hydrolase family protein n=1 Tax=Desulfobacter latus TaxID=2292 RepID=A0A850SUI0_9BACT|nr:HAD hydrolase family protein [Desulfobacter latus]NWH04799.1 HAD hydrolase family protein [Desulfobacter latus]
MPCVHSVKNRSENVVDAVVCDLDGTLLYPREEAFGVEGRSTVSFLSKASARLLARISQLSPLVIATGRNSVSTGRLVKQLPDVTFSGFVFENGFIVKQHIDDCIPYNGKWDDIAALFPNWERLPFYENCAGFIPPSPDRESAESTARAMLKKYGYDDLVYRENKKIFIYPGTVNKMRGLSILGIHPYIALGDQINDIQMMEQSTWPVMPVSGADELKTIVKKKDGFCSLLTSHEAAHEMLNFAYKKCMMCV